MINPFTTSLFLKQIREVHQSGNLDERLSFGGAYENITPRDATLADWLFALDEAKADLAQCCRHLSNPEEEQTARRAARRHCAEIAALAAALHARLPELS